jgi:hypothetical protein
VSTTTEAIIPTAPQPQVGLKGRILRRVVRTFNPLALRWPGAGSCRSGQSCTTAVE